MMKKILILEANPRSDLNLNDEIRDLKDVILSSRNREEFQINIGLSVRSKDLQRLILRHEPNVIHFCGHGLGQDGLVFQDKKINTESIADLFAICKEYVQCVVLNACYSQVQAEEIVKHIDYVIGMNQAIQDRAAIAFSMGFYQALGFGKSVEDAFEWGKNQIQLEIDESKSIREVNARNSRKLIAVAEDYKKSLPNSLIPILKQKQDLIEIGVETNSVRESFLKITKHSKFHILTKNLEQILSQEIDIKSVKRAYQRCRPPGLVDPPANSLTQMLEDLEEFIPVENEAHPILKFIALLLDNPDLGQKVRKQLKNWVESHIVDFGMTPSEFQLICNRTNDKSKVIVDSYFMVQIYPSQQNPKQYFVEAWFIPDSTAYQPETGFGYHKLELESETSSVYSLEEIPAIISQLYALSDRYINEDANKPIVEFFLSMELLNQNVDEWEIEDVLDESYSTPIGFEHQVRLRSHERLSARYRRYRGDWKANWDNLQNSIQSCCSELFFNGNIDWRELMQQVKLQDTFGIKLTKAPHTGKGSPLALIQRVAAPVAIWTRCNLENCEQQISELLECSVRELPQKIYEQRVTTILQVDKPCIGNNLALLWENPYLLPPNICYKAQAS